MAKAQPNLFPQSRCSRLFKLIPPIKKISLIRKKFIIPPKKMKNSNSSAVGPPSKAKVGTSLNVPETTFKSRRGVFQKDLQRMMYGFGDDINPLPETMALVEDIVVEYVTDLVNKAQDIASERGKLLTEDFLFLVRKDPLKLNRCTELLSLNEEIKRAKKIFDETLQNID